MQTATGVLSKYNLIQLSCGVTPHTIEFPYDDRPFTLGEPFRQFTDHLQTYWGHESPGLKDFQSIVSLQIFESLRGLDNNAAKLSLACRPTSYFQFLLSNYSLDVPLPGDTTLRAILAKDTELLPAQTGTITTNSKIAKSFIFPYMGNSVGITICVITADNRIVIAKRKSKSDTLARDKGNYLCAVGTQIKRHQPRFLDSHGYPSPEISARQGLHDEMGPVISESCATIECLGAVYRTDYQHTELLFETTSSLRWGEIRTVWNNTGIPDKREFESISCLDLDNVNMTIGHLRDCSWSPQHAAGVYHSLLRRFDKIDSCGLLL